MRHQLFYVKGDGFKASIAGRLGASSKFYDGVADSLCTARTLSDGEHFEYVDCGKSDAPYAWFNNTWQNVLVTYVNRNYNGAVSQNWSQQTLNFQYDSTGYKTNTKTDVWTTSHNMEFKNTGNSYSTGQMELKENAVSKRLCVGNGELNDEYGSGGNREVKISGYSKGSSTERTDSVYLNGIVPKTLNWDGLLKVEIRAPSDVCICIDDVVVKT